MSRHTTLVLLLASCTDYDLRNIDKPERGAPVDTGTIGADTAETEPEPADMWSAAETSKTRSRMASQYADSHVNESGSTKEA